MAKFLKSCQSINDWPQDDTPEFCFIGRSNAGKSTLINALANEKVAFTSKQPGRTLLLNFYDFKNFRIVDMPGYGYAKISKELQVDISEMIEDYLRNRSNLRQIFLVADLRNSSVLDQDMVKMIRSKFRNCYVILTKTDKVTKSNLKIAVEKASEFYRVEMERIVVTSALKKVGMRELLNMFASLK